MKKWMAGCIIFTCILTGCQEVPEQVREQMENAGTTKQVSAVDCNYCTIEELRNTSLDKISACPDNLFLPERVDFSDVEAVGLVTFKSQKKFTKNRDEVASFFGVKNPKWEHETDTEVNGYHYEDKEAGKYIGLDDSGFMHYASGEYDRLIQQDIEPEIIKKIHLNREACPEFVCHFKTGDVMLKSAVEYADNWMKGCKYCNPDFDYPMRTIYVYEQEGVHYLSMLCQPAYKGVGLSYITYPMAKTEDYSIVIEAVDSMVTLDMERESEVSGYTTQNNLTVVKEEMADKVIDFESAIKLVEEKMAGYSRLDVAEVRIEYVVKPIYDWEKGESAYGPDVVMEARPVYSFWIPNGGEDEGYGISEASEMVYINVDMLDGTVTDDFAFYSFHGND